jgi:competence protein ComEA
MRVAVLVVVVVLGVAGRASAQLADGPGKEQVQKVCGACHQADKAASVRLTREGWQDVIADMIKRGAKGTDDEFGQVLEYLSTHYLGDAPKPLNINRASNIELESVAGLTRKESAAVLAYLNKVGVCKSLDELKKVPGLDYKKIEARKDFVVCFEPPTVPPSVPKDPPKH